MLKELRDGMPRSLVFLLSQRAGKEGIELEGLRPRLDSKLDLAKAWYSVSRSIRPGRRRFGK